MDNLNPKQRHQRLSYILSMARKQAEGLRKSNMQPEMLGLSSKKRTIQ